LNYFLFVIGNPSGLPIDLDPPEARLEIFGRYQLDAPVIGANLNHYIPIPC
jgi:hypothetical protein